MAGEAFKLTYSTMFNPPEELHNRFDEALVRVKAELGKKHGMIIGGKEREAQDWIEDRSPANTDLILGYFPKGTVKDAQDAMAAARKAFPVWSHMKWQDRVTLIRKAAHIMDERQFEMGVVVAMEVGKNRMEAMGDVAETADLFRYACDRMEASNGYVVEMGHDPLTGYTSTNTSVLRPYGVWLVISPFNFPCALTGGPTAAALVAGNTVVIKPASDTPWTARLISECLRDAGIPEGVFNFVTGPGSTLGQALIESPEVDGITFTGSFDVGMKIYRDFATGGRYPRPAILEMGGKNPAVVTRNADVETAALGIMRSSFGLQGQKCSACSRIFVEEPVYDKFVGRLIELTEKLVIGDPTDRKVYLGPVINKSSYADYKRFSEELNQDGKILTGGKVLLEGEFSKGYFCTPTLAEIPMSHALWQTEMFVPITTISPFKSLNDVMVHANNVLYGLTSGIYGSEEEVDQFYDQIQSGVVYANRPQGATTGAWPGFQPFGGWKGSGSSGKNSGGVYYLPLYMHEQIRNHVTKG